MKVAFHADSPPMQPTGIGRYMMQLAYALSEAGSQPELWVRFRWLRALRRWSGPDYRIKPIFSVCGISDRISPLLHSLTGIDLLHCPNGNLLPVIGGVKRTAMIHDMSVFLFDDVKRSDIGEAWRVKTRNIADHADGILINSQTTLDDFLELFPEAVEKTFLTPLGMNHLFLPDKAPIRTPGAELGRILAVGTIEPRKNYDCLLKAYAILKQRRNDVPGLVIAGQKGYRANDLLKLLRELDLSSSIEITGYVSEERLKMLYRTCSCLVHTARYEGFGFTIPEAFAFGLPVVASNNSSMADFFGKAAIMVDGSNPEEIASAIEECLENGVSRDLIEERKRLFTTYTWENCAALSLSAFSRICSD